MGIALISIMICGSLYYVFIRTKPLAEGQVSLRALLIAGIDFAERGGEKVCIFINVYFVSSHLAI